VGLSASIRRLRGINSSTEEKEEDLKKKETSYSEDEADKHVGQSKARFHTNWTWLWNNTVRGVGMEVKDETEHEAVHEQQHRLLSRSLLCRLLLCVLLSSILHVYGMLLFARLTIPLRPTSVAVVGPAVVVVGSPVFPLREIHAKSVDVLSSALRGSVDIVEVDPLVPPLLNESAINDASEMTGVVAALHDPATDVAVRVSSSEPIGKRRRRRHHHNQHNQHHWWNSGLDALSKMRRTKRSSSSSSPRREFSDEEIATT